MLRFDAVRDVPPSLRPNGLGSTSRGHVLPRSHPQIPGIFLGVVPVHRQAHGRASVNVIRTDVRRLILFEILRPGCRGIPRWCSTNRSFRWRQLPVRRGRGAGRADRGSASGIGDGHVPAEQVAPSSIAW